MVRFIPACAGNSAAIVSGDAQKAVHPRVCGEQCHGPYLVHSVFGSSPRVRGTAKPSDKHMVRLRFIPACAGNSQF